VKDGRGPGKSTAGQENDKRDAMEPMPLRELVELLEDAGEGLLSLYRGEVYHDSGPLRLVIQRGRS